MFQDCQLLFLSEECNDDTAIPDALKEQTRSLETGLKQVWLYAGARYLNNLDWDSEDHTQLFHVSDWAAERAVELPVDEAGATGSE